MPDKYFLPNCIRNHKQWRTAINSVPEDQKRAKADELIRGQIYDALNADADASYRSLGAAKKIAATIFLKLNAPTIYKLLTTATNKEKFKELANNEKNLEALGKEINKPVLRNSLQPDEHSAIHTMMIIALTMNYVPQK